MVLSRGFAYATHSRAANPSCPLDGLTFLTASPASSSRRYCWCRTVRLLAIAYDYDVLGLGPD